MRSINCLPFTSTWVQTRLFGGVRVAHTFSCLCCPIMCIYVKSAVLWFPHKNEVRFVLTSSCLWDGACLSYLCLSVCSGVQQMLLCCVFFLSFFWLHLKYSLKIIYYTYQHYCTNDSNECQINISSLKSSYLMGIPRINFLFPLLVTIKWKQINILIGYAYPVSVLFLKLIFPRNWDYY
jgi:hypothetical protein